MGHYGSLLILLRLKVTSYDALLVCYRNSNKVFGQKMAIFGRKSKLQDNLDDKSVKNRYKSEKVWCENVKS